MQGPYRICSQCPEISQCGALGVAIFPFSGTCWAFTESFRPGVAPVDSQLPASFSRTRNPLIHLEDPLNCTFNFFLKILFLSHLCPQSGARTHNPKIKSRTLHPLSRPGAPSMFLSLLFSLYLSSLFYFLEIF